MGKTEKWNFSDFPILCIIKTGVMQPRPVCMSCTIKLGVNPLPPLYNIVQDETCSIGVSRCVLAPVIAGKHTLYCLQRL